MKEIIIESLKTYKPEVLEDFNNLLFQLNPDIVALSGKDVRTILNSNNIYIFVVRNEKGKIIGMATLVVFKVLSGKRAIIEDVVVDKDYRGQGLGKKLLQKMLSFAQSENVSYIDLTSKPSRVEANSLYLSLGFEKRDTNVYRYIIKNEKSK